MEKIMASSMIDQFIETCKNKIFECTEPVKCLHSLIADVNGLMRIADRWLCADYLKGCNDHYMRHKIYLDQEGKLGLYVLVWYPDQWTPIHDHGTWGIMGVLEGTLSERSFIRVDKSPDSNVNIELVEKGFISLVAGSISCFLPHPEHIHATGNEGDKAVSLHLYGQALASFNVYNLEQGTRALQSVDS